MPETQSSIIVMRRLVPWCAIPAAALVLQACSAAPPAVVAGAPIFANPRPPASAPAAEIGVDFERRMEIELAGIVAVREAAARSVIAPHPAQRGVRSRPGAPISEEELQAQRAAALLLAPAPAIQRLDGVAAPRAVSPSLGTGFESLNYNDAPGATPPDPELAVGPDHAVAVVNTSLEIYDKTGLSLVGPTTFSSLFAGVPSCGGLFDPNVLYDESADRYFLGIASGGSAFCIAVSQSSDPTGSWYLYRVPTAPGFFFDYPHTGVGEDVFVMGGNLFVGPNFDHAELYAIEKADAYSGSPLTVVSRTIAGFTPQPMNAHGFAQGTWPDDGLHYILNDAAFDGSSFGVFAWSDPLTTNLLFNIGTVDLDAFTGVFAGQALPFPQNGTSTMEGNDWRVQDAEYRNGHLWMAHTLSCNPGAGVVNCVRWAEIDPVTATVVQAGVIASDGEYRQFADLAVNHCGDMTIGYTKSSSTTFPGVYATGRLGSDPPNTLGPELEVKPGEILYTSFDDSPKRWGDYTGMTSDPDGIRTWYLGEYSENTGRTTRWGNYVQEFSTACMSLFADGFEAGDTSAWSTTQP
ncbi:MAG: hypothetical protein DWQ36_14385 [Acidobacteria bacterium]|nr:MAG: hypothetical protein DWQ30_19565 [Acidobacteriota bacterium]REK06392.1 MAG: hypothetical protein DWQ36_14385 [Acidobacteriota bacterium]